MHALDANTSLALTTHSAYQPTYCRPRRRCEQAITVLVEYTTTDLQESHRVAMMNKSQIFLPNLESNFEIIIESQISNHIGPNLESNLKSQL